MEAGQAAGGIAAQRAKNPRLRDGGPGRAMAKPGFGFVRGGVGVGVGVRRGEAGDVWPIRPVGVVTMSNKSNRSSLVKASARQRARLSVLETMLVCGGGRWRRAE